MPLQCEVTPVSRNDKFPNRRSYPQVSRKGLRLLRLVLASAFLAPLPALAQGTITDLRTYNQGVAQASPPATGMLGSQAPSHTVAPIPDTSGAPKGNICKGGVCPGLGNAFYLPGFNVLSHFTGGSVILEERRLNRCAVFSEVAQATRDFNFRHDTASTMSSMSTEANVSGSYDQLDLTLDATVKTATGYDATTTTDIQALTLDVTFQRGVLDFIQDGDCWSADNLTTEFVDAFKALPNVKSPHLAASWAPYVAFLRAWGSHIMVQQTLGSRFQQWESTRAASKVSQKTLAAKACANVEGVTATDGGWSVKGCAAYSDDERRSSLSVSTNQAQNILGGTVETRQALLKDVSKDSLDAFIDSADEADEAILHKWTPVWVLLAKVYGSVCSASDKSGCADMQRALNLEAAYEGWLAVGCPQVVARKQSIQYMRVASTAPDTGLQTYGCWAKKEGCIADADCSNGGAIGTVCYCYGGGCVEKDKAQPINNPKAPTGYRNKIRSDQSGSQASGVNQSCWYPFLASCRCEAGKRVGLGNRYLWLQ